MKRWMALCLACALALTLGPVRALAAERVDLPVVGGSLEVPEGWYYTLAGEMASPYFLHLTTYTQKQLKEQMQAHSIQLHMTNGDDDIQLLLWEDYAGVAFQTLTAEETQAIAEKAFASLGRVQRILSAGRTHWAVIIPTIQNQESVRLYATSYGGFTLVFSMMSVFDPVSAEDEARMETLLNSLQLPGLKAAESVEKTKEGREIAEPQIVYFTAEEAIVFLKLPADMLYAVAGDEMPRGILNVFGYTKDEAQRVFDIMGNSLVAFNEYGGLGMDISPGSTEVADFAQTDNAKLVSMVSQATGGEVQSILPVFGVKWVLLDKSSENYACYSYITHHGGVWYEVMWRSYSQTLLPEEEQMLEAIMQSIYILPLTEEETSPPADAYTVDVKEFGMSLQLPDGMLYAMRGEEVSQEVLDFLGCTREMFEQDGWLEDIGFIGLHPAGILMLDTFALGQKAEDFADLPEEKVWKVCEEAFPGRVKDVIKTLYGKWAVLTDPNDASQRVYLTRENNTWYMLIWSSENAMVTEAEEDVLELTIHTVQLK